jgi:hypothetical protein
MVTSYTHPTLLMVLGDDEGSRSQTEYRNYLRGGVYTRTKEQRLIPGRDNLVAVVEELTHSDWFCMTELLYGKLTPMHGFDG